MIQIIKYEVLKNDIEVGFRKYNFVVYGSVGKETVQGLSKDEVLQIVYKDCKDAIDYETKLYENGEKNSIITYEVGELFIPEEAIHSMSMTQPMMYINQAGEIIKRQDIEIDLNSLSTVRLPFPVKSGDTGVHEVNIILKPEQEFLFDSARVYYSNGIYQDIDGLTFIMKNTALINSGIRHFEIEFRMGEKIRRTGKIEYKVESSLNANLEAYDKYSELQGLYNELESQISIVNQITKQVPQNVVDAIDAIEGNYIWFGEVREY